MRLLQYLKNKYSKFSDRTLFDITIEDSRVYLESFPEPKDDIERGYFQYCCQMQAFGKLKRLIICIVAGLILLYYFLKLWLQKKPMLKDKIDAILLFSGSINIVPESLTGEFSIRQVFSFQDEFALIKDDRVYIYELIRRFPFSWYFIFKCVLKIAMYRYLIQSHSPKAFICSEEYSFTSSVLTTYCEKMGIEHINIMHGEKLFNIRDSFFRFNRCYIWDHFYKELFLELRAESSQFIVERPPSLMPWRIERIDKQIDYTYYLQKENDHTLLFIHNIMKQFNDAGFSVAIRPHPLQSDFKRIKELFKDLEIEDIKKIQIKESIMRSKHAISFYSSVLSQAMVNNVPIIIDDITRPDEFAKLKELKFICLHKSHSLLSTELAKLKY